MSEFTLKVPADYRGAFQAGVLLEVYWDAEKGAKEIPELLGKGGHGWFPHMAATGKLMAAALEADGEGDIEVEGDPEAIYRSLHEMMHKVTGPLVTESSDLFPLEPMKVTLWTKATEWALSEMARAEVAIKAGREE